MPSFDIYTTIGLLSLILQIVIFVLLVVGYNFKRKQKYRLHGTTMASAFLLHVILIFAIMIPSLVIAIIPEFILVAPLELASIVVIIHAILGSSTFALGGYVVFAWHFKKDFQGCFNRKKFMLAALPLWLTTLVFGGIIFVIFYGPNIFV
jgi:uncharacterized membrane protein YozB (DUF420 family)